MRSGMGEGARRILTRTRVLGATFFYDVHGVKACGRGICMSADILTAARGYAARGWVVHPLSGPKNKGKSPGKRALLTGWQKRDRPATEAELDKWFKNMDNN